MLLNKLLLAPLCLFPLLTAAAAFDSSYTDLAPARCRTLEVAGAPGASLQKCGGVAGYSLLVEDFDGRQSVTVVSPDGRRHELEYSRIITSGFASLGPKAEWRMAQREGKSVPVALIIRVYASEDASEPGRQRSYLAVTKITPERICVTDKVSGGAKGNENARLAAEAAAGKPCL